jgi:hypothetical protein
VALELLPDRVALALQRFAVQGTEPAYRRKLGVDRGNERVVSVQVAGLAGAIGLIAQIVGNRGGAPLCIDALD